MNTRRFIILGFHNRVGAHPMGVGRVHYYYAGGSDRHPTLSSDVVDATQYEVWDHAHSVTRRLNEQADGYVYWVWRAP